MIKSITVKNYLGESIKIKLDENDPSHGLLVRSVSGLGPPKATINTTNYAIIDGAMFSSARLETRNIVFQFIFTMSPMIEDARLRTYQFFPIKQPVEMIFETDHRLAKITGYVETNEPDIFSKEESNSVSIVCPDPYFIAENQIQSSVVFGIDPLFEFEFENNGVMDNGEIENLLEFGDIPDIPLKRIIYEGDGEPGIVIRMHVTGKVNGNIYIYESETNEAMKINLDNINQGDDPDFPIPFDLTISTGKGKKYAELLLEGIITNALNRISKDSDWFKLRKGVNTFGFDIDNKEVDIKYFEVTIENDILYEGV